MNLILNNAQHWQVPGGAEIHTGDFVEVYQDSVWAEGQVIYRPRRGYAVRLKDGREVKLDPEVELRLHPPGTRERKTNL